MIIAARAALRVLPMVITKKDIEDRQKGAAMLLPCCRAAAAAWVAGTWPTEAAVQAAAGAATADDARAPARAAYAAAYAAHSANANTAIDDAKAAAAAAAATVADAYIQINQDVEAIDNTDGGLTLSSAPLWTGRVPQELRDRWEGFFHSLPHPRHQNWQVWSDWYFERLRGVSRERPLIEPLEIARVLIPDEYWKQGPAHVNAIIAGLEETHREEAMRDAEERDPADETDVDGPVDVLDIPAQRPAIIEVEPHSDGKLHRRRSPPPEGDDGEADADLRDAYAAHRTILSSLEKSDPGRNWPDLNRALDDYAAAIGPSYDAIDVIALGVQGERLGQYAGRANEELMAGPAADLTALLAAHAVFIRQFPRWRRYLDRNRPGPTPEIVEAATQTADALKDFREIFSDDVVDAAERQARPFKDLSVHSDDRLPAVVESSLVDSVLNVIFGASAPAAEFARDAKGEVRNAALDLTYVASFLGLASVANLVLLLPMELTFVTALVAILSKRSTRGETRPDRDTPKHGKL